jgi:methylthioribose-1-phosphate isomerase
MALTSIKRDEDEIEIIDQLLLPHAEEWIRIDSPNDAYEAIKSMKIRGAPAIASLASLSIASHLSRALKAEPSPPFLETLDGLEAHLDPIFAHLFSSRPTAVNLGQAINRLRKVVRTRTTTASTARDVAGLLVHEGRQIADEDVGRNREMSRYGAEWILAQVEKRRRGGGGASDVDGLNVMTVCNTGGLATSVRTRLGWNFHFHANLSRAGIRDCAGCHYPPPRDWQAQASLLYSEHAIPSRFQVCTIRSN